MWCEASNIAIILAIYLVFRSNNTLAKCFDKFYFKRVLISCIKHGLYVLDTYVSLFVCVINGQSRKMIAKNFENILRMLLI